MTRVQINKVLVVSGGLTLLTGIFMLFHFESHFAKAVHQIGGLVLVGFCITHIKINWKALVSSFTSRAFVWGVVVVFALSVIIMIFTGHFAEH